MNNETQSEITGAEVVSTSQKVDTQLETQKSVFLFRIALVLLGIGALVLFALFMITQSLPGTSLYQLKTNGVERSIEKTHIYSKDKAWYQVTLMKKRLQEAKELSLQSNVSEKALADTTSQINSESAVLALIIDQSIDSAFPKTDMLSTLNEFISVAGAIEAVGEHDAKLKMLGDAAEEIRQTTNQTYKDRVKSFVQTETPQTALSYIQEELLRVKTESDNNPDLSKKAVRTVGNYLDRVEPAVLKSDYFKAIIAIGEAYRLIKIETYWGGASDEALDTTTDTATSTPTEALVESTTTLPQ